MDFSMPLNAMGGPREYRHDLEDSESEDEKPGMQDSNEVLLRWSRPPAEAKETPGAKAKVETTYSGADANRQKAMAVVGELEDVDVVPGGWRGGVKKENMGEVEGDMDVNMGVEKTGTSAPARKKKHAKGSNTTTASHAEKVAGAVTQATRVVKKKKRREVKMTARKARELDIAVSNSSLDGLTKSVRRRVRQLRGDEMTQMFALAGSMSLESKVAAGPSAAELSAKVGRERIAGELQPFLAEGGKQAGIDYEASRFQGAENTERPSAQLGSYAPPKTTIGPRQPGWVSSPQDTMQVTAPTSAEKAIKLQHKKRNRLMRQGQPMQNAAKVVAGIITENTMDGVQHELIESDDSVRARVTREFQFALSGVWVGKLSNGAKRRVTKYRKAWLPEDPSAPRPDFDETLAKVLEQEKQDFKRKKKAKAKKKAINTKYPTKDLKIEPPSGTFKDLGKGKDQEKNLKALGDDGTVFSAFSQMELGEGYGEN